jgi:hypothetical protein
LAGDDAQGIGLGCRFADSAVTLQPLCDYCADYQGIVW